MPCAREPRGAPAESLALPTLRRRLAAIASRHATAALETQTDHPLVRRTLRRYARTRGTAVEKKDALLVERFPALLLEMPEVRIRAIELRGDHLALCAVDKSPNVLALVIGPNRVAKQRERRSRAGAEPTRQEIAPRLGSSLRARSWHESVEI